MSVLYTKIFRSFREWSIYNLSSLFRAVYFYLELLDETKKLKMNLIRPT